MAHDIAADQVAESGSHEYIGREMIATTDAR